MRSTIIIPCLTVLTASVLAQSSGSGTVLTSSLTGRESLVTITTTDVATLTSTDVNMSVFTTTLPRSIRTYTTETAVGTTLVPVYTESVIYSSVVIRTNTLVSNGVTSTQVTTSTATSAVASSASSVLATSSAAVNGAAATYVPYAVAGALAGFAALL